MFVTAMMKVQEQMKSVVAGLQDDERLNGAAQACKQYTGTRDSLQSVKVRTNNLNYFVGT